MDPGSSEVLFSSDVLRVCVSPPLDKGHRDRGSAGALGQGAGTAGARLADSQLFEAGGGGGGGALQRDSWVSLAGGLILACHLCLLPAVAQRGADGGRMGPKARQQPGGRGLPPKKPGKSLAAYSWVLNSFHPSLSHQWS